MNCQIPHDVWRTSKPKNPAHCRAVNNEDIPFNFDGHVTCPRISILENGLLHNNTTQSWPVLVDLDEHQTLPTPMMQPNASTKCGRDPAVSKARTKDELNYFLFKETLALECRLLIRSSVGAVNLSTLANDWKKYMKKKELPKSEHCLITIMDRYGCDKPLKESYAGGNLAIVWLQNERYLIHSVMKTFDCQLCLTRVMKNDMKNYPTVPSSTKMLLNDGIVCQIAVPRQSSSWDPSLVEQNGAAIYLIFATRQLHTTRLWKIEQNETGSQPIFTNMQEHSDPSSTVTFVELNQFEWGEFCELRPKGVKISQGGLLRNEKTFKKKYDSCVYLNPKILILSSSRTLDLLDFRCRNTENLQSIFSIENWDLRTFYNMPTLGKMLSFSASSRDNIYLISTEKMLLVWDIRCGNRPLCRTAHQVESPPDWISTVQIGPDKDWVFIDSMDPASSVMVGLSWGNQENPRDRLKELPAVSVEIEPRVRWNILDTFDAAHERGLGLDWSIQNRYKQMRSGIACDKDSDGTIQIWQCSVAGDIFSQQLNPNKRIGPTQQKASDAFFSRLDDWIEDVDQIAELNASLSQNLWDHTEEYDPGDLIDIIRKISEELEEENCGSLHTAAMLNHKYAKMSDTLEINCPVDKTQNLNGRAEVLNKLWVDENIPGPSQNFVPEDTFSLDFQEDFVSSTPFQPIHRPKDGHLHGFLRSSTPAIHGFQPGSRPSRKNRVISTPFRRQTPQTWKAPSQRKSVDKAQDWDF